MSTEQMISGMWTVHKWIIMTTNRCGHKKQHSWLRISFKWWAMPLSRHIRLVRQRSCRAELLVVVGDNSRLELEECYDCDSELIDLPICCYLTAKLTSQDSSVALIITNPAMQLWFQATPRNYKAKYFAVRCTIRISCLFFILSYFSPNIIWRGNVSPLVFITKS